MYHLPFDVKRSQIKVINAVKLRYEMCYNWKTDEIGNTNKHKADLCERFEVKPVTFIPILILH